MLNLLRSRAVQIFLLLSAIYWIVGGWLTPNSSNLEFEHLVRTCIAVSVTIAYVSVCWEAILVRTPDRVQQLSLGIVLSWFSTILASFWALIYRYGGRPQWMIDSNIYGYFIFLQILGGILHITAPGAAGQGIPKKNWISLGVAAGIGVFLVLVATLYEPDAHALVDYLEYYFRSQPD